MEDRTNKEAFDASGIIERAGGRNRKLRAYSPPVDNPPEDTPPVHEEAPKPAVKEKEQEPPRPESRRRKPKGEPQDFIALFLQETAITARSGKTVYITKEHHERIIKILHVIGKNEVSLFSYIYNVLEHHFNTFQDEITELYENNIEKIF